MNTTPLNILFLANAFPPIYMGGEATQLFLLVSSLKERGHNPIVVHPVPFSGKGIMVTLETTPLCTVYKIFFPGQLIIPTLNLILEDLFHRIRTSQGNIHLVHCHSNKFCYSLQKIKDRFRVPIVSTIHAVDCALRLDVALRKHELIPPSDLLLYRNEVAHTSKMCEYSNAVIAISKAMASFISKYFCHDTNKIIYIPNGIPCKTIATLNDPNKLRIPKTLYPNKDQITLIFAGRIEQSKGIRPLARAIKTLLANYQGFRFFFIGNGTEEHWLKTFLADSPRVAFINWIPFEQLLHYYHIADIVVLPSFVEAFGLVALEAMACNCAVLASNADGLDELIEHRIDGLKVPLLVDKYGDRALSDHELYMALETLLTDSSLRESLSRAAKHKAEQFDIEYMVSRLETLYLNLAFGGIS